MKKILSILLIVILAFSMISCKDKAEDGVENPPTPKQEEANDNTENTTPRDINAVATTIGIESAGEETLYGQIDAEDGKQYEDGKIEIYQFDPESEAYQELKKTMKIFDGEIDVTAVNDGFVLIFSGYEDPVMLTKFKEIIF